LKKPLRLKPDHPLALLLLGRAYQNSNRSLQAIEEFKTALRLKPDIELGHYHLVTLMPAWAAPPEAIAEYGKEVARDAPMPKAITS